MESADYVPHGRDATVSGHSVQEGTNKGISDDPSGMKTHALRVVPSQQFTGTMKSADYVPHGRDATVSGRSVREEAQTREHRMIHPRRELTFCASFRRSNARAR